MGGLPFIPDCPQHGILMLLLAQPEVWPEFAPQVHSIPIYRVLKDWGNLLF